MEWFLLVGLVAGGGGFVAKRWRERSAVRTTEREELEGVRRFADEDVTLLGEQLQRLDREVSGRELDEQTRVDYQVALDAYESAQRAVPRIRDADEISTITDILSSGRYALACVQARVAGRPIPERRVPCFFNPQHGPSVRDVMWTGRGAGTRKVPACSQDAARVENREKPELRTVKLGARTVPYWEAGSAYLPYTQGYFASAALLTWAGEPSVFSVGAGGGGEFRTAGDQGWGGFDGGVGDGGEGGEGGGG